MLSHLEKRHCDGNLRRLPPNQPLIDLASNDYLGLARSFAGSTGSRLLTGNSSAYEALETKIAAFHGYPAALIFNCGYMANIGLISSVAQAGDLILYDTHVHASTHDGIRLSSAASAPWKHNTCEHLKTRLERRPLSGKTYVCVESIYSTDGSVAPLAEIEELCEKYDAKLIVDEAHAVGVMGHEGRGLTGTAFAKVVTFGKALGVQGAAVLGSAMLKHYLINFARSFIYTTALPKQAIDAIDAAYDLFPRMEAERAHLKSLIACLNLSASPIQPYRVKNNAHAHALSVRLQEAGFDVRPLLRPTVRRGEECLRITLHAFNTQEQIKKLKEYVI